MQNYYICKTYITMRREYIVEVIKQGMLNLKTCV